MSKVLIVAPTSGLGKALAELYKEYGWSVQAVNQDTCGLSDPTAVAKLAADPGLLDSGFELCIFSAGMSEAGYIDELDPHAFRRCLEVNFLAPMTLFYALATRYSILPPVCVHSFWSI